MFWVICVCVYDSILIGKGYVGVQDEKAHRVSHNSHLEANRIHLGEQLVIQSAI